MHACRLPQVCGVAGRVGEIRGKAILFVGGVGSARSAPDPLGRLPLNLVYSPQSGVANENAANVET